MIDCLKNVQEPHRITYTHYKGSWDFGVTPRKRSETCSSFLLHFFLLSKTRKKKDHFCSYFFFLLNKKHKIFSVLWNPTVPPYFFLWLALSSFDEATVPKESTIFFQARFKGQGWIGRAMVGGKLCGLH